MIIILVHTLILVKHGQNPFLIPVVEFIFKSFFFCLFFGIKI